MSGSGSGIERVSTIRAGWDFLVSDFRGVDSLVLAFLTFEETNTLLEVAPAFYSAVTTLQPLSNQPAPPEPRIIGPPLPRG
eukprot:7633223-Karenia_brevis.AAC.1